MRLERGVPTRIAVAILAGIAGGLYCYFSLKASGGPRIADDFTWQWLAVRALAQGHDPYAVITAGGQYHLDQPYVYPLTTAIVAFPFARWLPPVAAAALWMAASTGLLAFAMTRRGYTGLLIFASMPFIWAASSAQTSVIVTAGTVLPLLGFMAALKPQIGLAALAYKPSKTAFIGLAAIGIVSLVVNPTWPMEWINILPHRVPGVYRIPLTVMGGPLLLLAVMRWRLPEARLLLIMALVPQTMLFYDQLILWLIPKTKNEYMILGSLSMIAPLIASFALPQGADIRAVTQAYAPVIVALIYLPCLILVLRRRDNPHPEAEPLPSP
jgi:hypothetical protein